MMILKKTGYPAIFMKLLLGMTLFLMAFLTVYVGIFQWAGRFGLHVIHPHQKVEMSDFQLCCEGMHFFYLSSGSQSFNFLSEDRKYVLKLFRFNRYTTVNLGSALPQQWGGSLEERNRTRIAKETALLESLRLATKMEELTQIVGYNFKERVGDPYDIHIHDRLHRSFRLDLRNTFFVLQRYGRAVSDCVDEPTFSTEGVSALRNLYQQMVSYGVEDVDPVIQKNCGFYHDIPFFIDVGGFRMSQKAQNIDTLFNHFTNQHLKRCF